MGKNFQVINKLVIRSFKTIVAQEIHLGHVNVFIGANGSGKSNVLEAIGILSAAASGRVDDESLKHRGVRPGVPRLYKSAFAEKISPLIHFEAHTQQASYSISLNNPLESPRPAWQYKTEELESDSKKIATRGPKFVKNTEQGIAALKLVDLDLDHPAAQLMNTLREFAIYAPNTLMLRGLTSDPQTREPVGLSGGRLAEAVKELKFYAKNNDFITEALENVLDLIDWSSGFDATSVADTILSSSVSRQRHVLRFHDRYMRKGKNTLTAYDASEGALYVLFCAVLTLLPNAPKCVAVDNLDQALNPRLIKKLTGLLCNWVVNSPTPRQLLFTAHNPAVLDGLPLTDDKVRLFAVDRNNKGHTIINHIEITDKLRAISRDGDLPLSRLWVMGHFGGIPNV